MDIWVTPKEWAEGKYNLPPMKISTQNYLRSKKKKAIKFSKNGRNIIYQLSWVLDYYKENTTDAKPKAN